MEKSSDIGESSKENFFEYDFDDESILFEAEQAPQDTSSKKLPTESAPVCTVTTGTSVSVVDESDWELNLDAVEIPEIANDNLNSSEGRSESDFLEVRGRGKKSTKISKFRNNTTLYINSKACNRWAGNIINKGYCTVSDIEELLFLCEGCNDEDELTNSIIRCLEYSGIKITGSNTKENYFLTHKISNVDANDLTESIESLLNRSISLPGTQRFRMDRSKDYKYLNPLIKANQELLIYLLSNSYSIDYLFHMVDEVFKGNRQSSNFSLKNIKIFKEGHLETMEVLSAVQSLKTWSSGGRVLDGKARRSAIEALEVFDIPLSFFEDLLVHLGSFNQDLSTDLRVLISKYKIVVDQILIKHLPFARRFASRNTEQGEDPEDVFQVAFMGLQRSMRRFDPERGERFTTYCTFWMYQAITRWRADEGSLIRIPVHRQQNLAKVDEALKSTINDRISDKEIAKVTQLSKEQVYDGRCFPRTPIFSLTLDEWDELVPAFDADLINQEVIEELVTEMLSDLKEREADVIRLRFGIGCESEKTLEEIGSLYGLTRERIRQIEAKALQRLSLPGRISILQEKLGV